MVAVALDWKPLPHQVPLLLWQPDRALKEGASTVSVLGGYGAGKSFSAAMAFILSILRQGWHPGYGRLHPIAAVIGPTLTHARERMLRVIDALLPPELVMRRLGMPNPRLFLANGVEIQALSAEASVEGPSWCGCWIDEIDKPEFVDHPSRWTNYGARPRGPLRDKHPIIYVSGLPTCGFVRDQFDKPNDGKHRLFQWATKLNTHNGEGYVDQIKDKVPAGEALTFLEGGWQPQPNSLFPQWDELRHLTDEPGNRNAPVDVAFDAGNRSSVLVGQRIKVPGSTDTRLHVIDEVIGDGMTHQSQIAAFKAKGWDLNPSKSTVSVDPSLKIGEMEDFYAAFPRHEIVKRERSDEYHDVKRGIRLVQAALKSESGNTRLTFYRGLTKNQRGVIDAMTRLRFNPNTGEPKVNDTFDHAADSLRMLACTVLGPQFGSPVIT